MDRKKAIKDIKEIQRILREETNKDKLILSKKDYYNLSFFHFKIHLSAYLTFVICLTISFLIFNFNINFLVQPIIGWGLGVLYNLFVLKKIFN